MRDLLLRHRATSVLMIVTGLVSLGIIISGNLANAATAFGFIPARVGGLDVTPSVLWWLTPLTATLVHWSVLQMALNFILFAYCGRQVESIIGAGPMVLLYLIGAYAAAAGQFALGPLSVIPLIGASGAISALVGAFAVSFGQPKRIVASFKLNRWLNVAWLMAAWVIVQIMIGYVMGQQNALQTVGANIGGFIAGVLLQKPLLLWRYRRA